MLALKVSFLTAAEPKTPVASLTTGMWCTKLKQNDDWGCQESLAYRNGWSSFKTGMHFTMTQLLHGSRQYGHPDPKLKFQVSILLHLGLLRIRTE